MRSEAWYESDATIVATNLREADPRYYGLIVIATLI